jgi:nicotinamide-nucleotide amidase
MQQEPDNVNRFIAALQSLKSAVDARHLHRVQKWDNTSVQPTMGKGKRKSSTQIRGLSKEATNPRKRSNMQAEILATGDELRSGALVDTNSAYIATKLEEIGIRIARHITVGDDLKILIDIFQEAGQRADIVIVTGGLGPTRDDLSRDAAAQTVGDELLLDNTSLAKIENFFVARQRPMPASNCRQAMFPASAEVLPNPVGTAPGFVIKIGQARFFFLPGVPPEMKKMLTNEVLPRIRQLGRDEHCYRTETITTFGIGESSLEERVEEFYDRFPKIKLGFRAHFPEVQLKLYLKGSNEIELDRQREQAVAWLRTELKHKIVSLEGKSLPRVVGDLLLEQEATLAVAESCTGGLIADWLTD